MVVLVEDCINSEVVVDIVGCIDVLQVDEILFMQDWFVVCGEMVLNVYVYYDIYMLYEMMGMVMLEQMVDLVVVNGVVFD